MNCIRLQQVTRCIFEILKWRQQSSQLKQGFIMKTATMDIRFELQHLEQISEFSEVLFPSHFQAGYHHVSCVPNGGWVHCGEVIKATWSEELSDKCAAVIYVWNKELHINVRLNQTVRLINLWNIQRHIQFKIPKVKFLKIGTLLVGMMRLVTDITERAQKWVELEHVIIWMHSQNR